VHVLDGIVEGKGFEVLKRVMVDEVLEDALVRKEFGDVIDDFGEVACCCW
jgi:hypothetical protein